MHATVYLLHMLHVKKEGVMKVERYGAWHANIRNTPQRQRAEVLLMRAQQAEQGQEHLYTAYEKQVPELKLLQSPRPTIAIQR
jgi:hypothetical protein